MFDPEQHRRVHYHRNIAASGLQRWCAPRDPPGVTPHSSRSRCASPATQHAKASGVTSTSAFPSWEEIKAT